MYLRERKAILSTEDQMVLMNLVSGWHSASVGNGKVEAMEKVWSEVETLLSEAYRFGQDQGKEGKTNA